MARRPDGSEGVYELNTNFLDALVDPAEAESDAAVVTRGLAAHAIPLSVVGVPAIYYHSMLRSEQDRAGMEASGIPRRINREVLDADRLAEELAVSTRRRDMLDGLTRLLAVRRGLPALSPFASQQVEDLGPSIFAVRRAVGTADELLAVVNVTDRPVELPGVRGLDAFTGTRVDHVVLPPFGFAWLRTQSQSQATDSDTSPTGEGHDRAQLTCCRDPVTRSGREAGSKRVHVAMPGCGECGCGRPISRRRARRRRRDAGRGCRRSGRRHP